MLIVNKKTRKMQGFTLTEAAIVLGIVGLILGAIWTAASAVYSSQRVNKANNDVMKIIQAVRSLYATQTTMPLAITAATTTDLITAGAVPTDMLNTAGTGIRNSWGGAGWVGGTGDGQGIVIELTGVPQDACVRLVSTVGGAVRDAGLTTAQGGADAGPTAVAVLGAPLGAPKAPTAVGTACALPGTNGVTFVFSLK